MNKKIKYIALIFLIPFLSGLFFVAVSLHHEQRYDALTFIAYAQSIASGSLNACGMVKEPGYPIVISPLFLFFNQSKAILLSRVMNLLLVACSSVIFFLILRLLKPNLSLRKTFIFSLFFALSPQILSFSALRVYSEPLQLILNALVIFCLLKICASYQRLKASWLVILSVIAGLSAGLLSITKVFFLLYPLWMAAFIAVVFPIFKKTRLFKGGIFKFLVVFVCISYIPPFLWSMRNYKKYGYFMVSVRGATTLLAHTYVVDWGLKDSLKWGVFQLSDTLGTKLFPSDTHRMDKFSGEPSRKAEDFAKYSQNQYKKSEISAAREWLRIVRAHPYKYIWFYFLNTLNHVFIEGIYPDIYPQNKTAVIKYLYIFNAAVLHILYSLFIWLVILYGVIKTLFRPGFLSLIIAAPLLYFLFLAYHFHTEIRYLHPLYINIYLLFSLCLCNITKND